MLKTPDDACIDRNTRRATGGLGVGGVTGSRDLRMRVGVREAVRERCQYEVGFSGSFYAVSYVRIDDDVINNGVSDSRVYLKR